jgi:hypothetical protein
MHLHSKQLTVAASYALRAYLVSLSLPVLP